MWLESLALGSSTRSGIYFWVSSSRNLSPNLLESLISTALKEQIIKILWIRRYLVIIFKKTLADFRCWNPTTLSFFFPKNFSKGKIVNLARAVRRAIGPFADRRANQRRLDRTENRASAVSLWREIETVNRTTGGHDSRSTSINRSNRSLRFSSVIISDNILKVNPWQTVYIWIKYLVFIKNYRFWITGALYPHLR